MKIVKYLRIFFVACLLLFGGYTLAQDTSQIDWLRTIGADTVIDNNERIFLILVENGEKSGATRLIKP